MCYDALPDHSRQCETTLGLFRKFGFCWYRLLTRSPNYTVATATACVYVQWYSLCLLRQLHNRGIRAVETDCRGWWVLTVLRSVTYALLFPHICSQLFVTSADVGHSWATERSFSTMRRLNSYLKSTTSDWRLHALAQMSINHDLPIHPEKVVDKLKRSDVWTYAYQLMNSRCVCLRSQPNALMKYGCIRYSSVHRTSQLLTKTAL